MKVEKFATGILGTNTYLVINEETKQAVVVDPAALPKRLKNYIEENLSERITVEDIANHVSLSASRLHHIFKYETGISILKYINKKRLAKAKELLKTGDAIVNIYHKCGFQDYSSFLRAYKKEYGISPKAYQNQYYKE